MMRAAILVNPRSGRGRAEHLAESVAGALGAAGVESETIVIGSEPSEATAARARGGRALVVVGGDGTVHAAIEPALSSGAPIYHVPAGTENLFAREFRMSRDAGDVVAAVRAGPIARVDLGRASGRAFAIMCSVGPDAQVIHDVASQRGATVSHFDYVGPIARVMLGPRTAPLSAWVDGREVIRARRGLLLMANCRRYALGHDPARRARVDDGLLDIVFLPTGIPGAIAWWMALTRFGVHDRIGGAMYVRGQTVRIESAEPLPMQIDGEAAGFVGGDRGAMEVGIEPGALGVLLPAARR